MKVYVVEVVEKYRRVIEIRANNERDAKHKAANMWMNQQIELDATDFERMDVGLVYQRDEG